MGQACRNSSETGSHFSLYPHQCWTQTACIKKRPTDEVLQVVAVSDNNRLFPFSERDGALWGYGRKLKDFLSPQRLCVLVQRVPTKVDFLYVGRRVTQPEQTASTAPRLIIRINRGEAADAGRLVGLTHAPTVVVDGHGQIQGYSAAAGSLLTAAQRKMAVRPEASKAGVAGAKADPS